MEKKKREKNSTILPILTQLYRVDPKLDSCRNYSHYEIQSHLPRRDKCSYFSLSARRWMGADHLSQTDPEMMSAAESLDPGLSLVMGWTFPATARGTQQESQDYLTYKHTYTDMNRQSHTHNQNKVFLLAFSTMREPSLKRFMHCFLNLFLFLSAPHLFLAPQIWPRRQQNIGQRAQLNLWPHSLIIW